MAALLDAQGYNEHFSGLEILEEEYDEDFEPTEHEVLEQCNALGIDPFKEPDLLYIAREALKAPLPENWKPVKNAGGDIFYFNVDTQESTWEHPCDTFYASLLQEERGKKALSHARNEMMQTPPMTPGGPPLMMKGPGGIGSLGHRTVPDLPGSLQSHKPSALAPIGANLDPIAGAAGGGGRLAPLGSLPPLKSMGGAKEPLPALKAPPLGTVAASSIPASLTKAPPIGLVNDPQGFVSEGVGEFPKSSLNKTLQSSAVPAELKQTLKPGPSSTGSGAAGNIFLKGSRAENSTLYMSSMQPSRPPFSHSADLAVGQISNQFEEEDDEEDEETSEEEENSFDKKFNIMGMEDFGSEEATTSAEMSPVEEERGVLFDKQLDSVQAQHEPTKFSASYFLKGTNENPQQGVSSQGSSPTGSPYIRPKAARGSRTMSNTPNTATVSHTPPQQTQLAITSKTSSPRHVEPSSSATKMANTRERAELEKGHQENMDRLRQQHAKELEQLKSQFQQEIKYEKDELDREKTGKLSLTKEQLDAEVTQEENKLRRQHQERMETIRKRLKEEEEEEEAELQEKKEDTLRTIKNKLTQEREEEERKSGDDIVAKLKSSIEKEREGEEKKLRDAMKREINSLKEKLKQEKDADMRQARKEVERGVEQQKEELKAELEKTNNRLLEQHQKEIDTLKQSLSKEHGAKLDTLRKELTGEFERRQGELAEQKALQTAVEEEAKVSLESKKKELEERRDRELSAVRQAHEEEMSKLREQNRQALLSEEETGELKLAEARRKKAKEIDEMMADLEREKAELLKEKKQFEESRSEFERETEELERKRKEMETLKQDLENERLVLEKVENELKTKKTTLQSAAETMEVAKEEHPSSDKKMKDKLKKMRQAVEEEKKALDELRALRDALSMDVSRLQQQKCDLRELSSTQAAVETAKTTKMQVPPTSTPTNEAIHNDSCLVFSNPATVHHASSGKVKTTPTNLNSDVTVTTSRADDDESEMRTNLTTMTSEGDEETIMESREEDEAESREVDETESKEKLGACNEEGQMSTLYTSDLEPSITVPPRKRMGKKKKKTSHQTYHNDPPLKERRKDPLAKHVLKEPKRASCPLRKGDTGPHYNNNNTGDFWRVVQDQIEKEGKALQKLERDFNRGPIKRLERIERMLEDMEDDKEFVDTDYSIEAHRNNNNSCLKDTLDSYVSRPCLDQTKRRLLHETTDEEDRKVERGWTKAAPRGSSAEWCQTVLSPHKHSPNLPCSTRGLQLRDLQRNSCELSSDSESSDSDSSSIELRHFSPETVQILNQARSRRSGSSGRRRRRRRRRRHGSGFKQSLTDPDMSVALERISGQLGDVTDRLDEKVDQNKSPYTMCEPSGQKWAHRKLSDDRELHDRWQSYLDNAARDEKRRGYLSRSRQGYSSPPVGKTRTDLAGQALIQKQRNWLEEFRQSIPLHIRQQTHAAGHISIK